MINEITADDIVECTGKQIDFDLELFVYRSLLERSIPATHGGTYIDPVTQKARQFDVRASRQLAPFDWRIELAIECKSLTADNPLVVYRVPRPVSDSFHEVMVCNRKIRMVVVEQSNDAGLTLYRRGGMEGKKTAQIRRNKAGGFDTGDSESYEKWSQALASANDLVINAKSNLQFMKGNVCVVIVIPVLVVSDEALWVVDYSEAGAMELPPKRVEEATLFVDRKYSENSNVRYNYRISHLHIYTRKGFLEFRDNVADLRGLYFDRIFKFLLDKWGGTEPP